VINLHFVSDIYSENVFAVNQSATLAISRLTEFLNFSKLLSLGTKSVSSTKCIVFMRFEVNKSFINSKKDNGFKIESLGISEKMTLEMI